MMLSLAMRFYTKGSKPPVPVTFRTKEVIWDPLDDPRHQLSLSPIHAWSWHTNTLIYPRIGVAHAPCARKTVRLSVVADAGNPGSFLRIHKDCYVLSSRAREFSCWKDLAWSTMAKILHDLRRDRVILYDIYMAFVAVPVPSHSTRDGKKQ